jgi:hypothetical protein
MATDKVALLDGQGDNLLMNRVKMNNKIITLRIKDLFNCSKSNALTSSHMQQD